MTVSAIYGREDTPKRRRSSLSIKSLCEDPIAPHERILPPLDIPQATLNGSSNSLTRHGSNMSLHSYSVESTASREQSANLPNQASSIAAPGSPTSSILSGSYTAAVSIDDPDVRLAAEALGDLATNGSDSSKAEFLSRVSTYPVVSSALKSYENTKTKSRLLNYGAGMVESVARPLVSQLEPLDSFACRQLDRIESRYTAHQDQGNGQKNQETEINTDLKLANKENNSTWHNVLISTSGLASSVSDESVRSLRYVLSVLNYANSQIARAAKSLRTILSQYENAGSNGGMPEAKRERLNSRVATIKRDILRTIQWVVEGIGQHSGSSLPEHARSRVREYVLGLPNRWVAAASGAPASTSNTNGNGVKQETDIGNDVQNQSEQGTYRLLRAALETLDVLDSVAKVVQDTIQSAQNWCDRLGRTKVAQSEEEKLEKSEKA